MVLDSLWATRGPMWTMTCKPKFYVKVTAEAQQGHGVRLEF